MTPYIKDLQTGNIRPYGSNHHDSLMISQDGTYLTYEHLQCGDGSIAGDKEHSGFVFCDDEGHTPEEDEILCRYGADAYFNIGGWGNPIDVLDKIRAEIKQAADKQFQIAMGVSDLNERYAHIQMENAYRHSLDIIDKYKAESEPQKADIPTMYYPQVEGITPTVISSNGSDMLSAEEIDNLLQALAKGESEE